MVYSFLIDKNFISLIIQFIESANRTGYLDLTAFLTHYSAMESKSTKRKTEEVSRFCKTVIK